MGNAESQNVEHQFYGEKHASLGRKHTSRSLRLSNKASRRTRHASSGKIIHRNSEVSTRSSSTPSIPQSLAENGLEPFTQEGNLEDFGSPIWVDRVDMGLRPVSYHTDSSVTHSMDSSTVHMAASIQSMPNSEEGRLYADGYLAEGSNRQHSYSTNGTTFLEPMSFKKKRSKSADIWREDSLEFSLSDLSQEHLTSNEEILCSAEEKDGEENRGREANNSHQQLGTCQRANSMSDLYSPKNTAATTNGGPRNTPGGYCRNLVSHIPDIGNHKTSPTTMENVSSYSNYNTLPCRKSHCLSEVLPVYNCSSKMEFWS
uniref:T-lymphoma invasion and metastasis-inducing protein 1 n=1 Tax=Sphaerodactylus townsendi TaxID=933632 RepID=A0ACB8FH46_9SAUR